MTRQAEAIQQRQLRDAATAFYHALPAMHKELFALMAADAGKPVHAVIAGAIEESVAAYRATLGGQMFRR